MVYILDLRVRCSITTAITYQALLRYASNELRCHFRFVIIVISFLGHRARMVLLWSLDQLPVLTSQYL
jgi:hypothetical protein